MIEIGARCALALLFVSGIARAEGLDYRLMYSTTRPDEVMVTLTLPEPHLAPIALIVPRSYPGGYAQIPYDRFVSQVVARAKDGSSLSIDKDVDGPRWNIGQAGQSVGSIEYRVDIARMEHELHDSVSASKVREGYVGLLGYSIFGYLEGLENLIVRLRIEVPEGWPVLSTLYPQVPALRRITTATARDFHELADSQILMGPRLRLSKSPGTIDLVMAIFAEGEVDSALETQLARAALNQVQAYFADVPIRQYTVHLELLQGLPGHSYGFSQEHLSSGTFNALIADSLREDASVEQSDRVRFNFAHHMAHSWIPKRVYGVGYRPFNWELTPVIDTVWFNEGFARYVAMQAVVAGMSNAQGIAYRAAQLARLRAILDTAATFIRRMPLDVLSREASFLYADDFRVGRNVFARGALMAAEMDERMRSGSAGKKSLRDALQWLLRWGAENQRPFQAQDLPKFFKIATGVDVQDIFEKWQRPLAE